ncbi:MAG: hypothetical protein QOE19_3970 [Actinomycetota bacterium]|jgi:hypothetical protein|nr:hypothetical protein [Actinomycetota bacterium]
MLTSDDRELVARDRALPGLATLLDGEALGELLSDYLTPGGEVRIDYLRYKPGTSLTCSLLLDTPLGEVRAFGVAGSADFAAKLPKMTGLHRSSGLHRPLASDARRHVVVSTLENDPALPGLRGGMRGARRALPDGLSDGRLRVLRYRPLRRAVAVVESDGAPAAVVRIVEPKEVDGHLRRFRTAVAQQLPVPRELGHHRRRGVIASAFVVGSVSDNGTLDEGIQRLAGTALADWHSRQPGLGRFRLPEGDVLPSMRATAGLVTELVPELADDVRSVARCVAARLSAATPQRVLVHGDFSVDQLVRTSTGLTVLDLDRLRQDAPEWDVATWFAAEVLAGHVPPGTEPEEALAPLLAAYQEAGGADLGPELRLYAAAALLQRAGEPFRLRQASWAHRVGEIVRAAAGLSAVPA